MMRVSDSADHPRKAATLLVTAHGLDDRVILESMVAIADVDGVSKADAIAAVVAEKVLQLGISDGSRVVFPTSGILSRGMTNITEPDITLAACRQILEEAASPSRILDAGMQLGDRATHCAAGFWGNRIIRRVMDRNTRNDYARRMAGLGYSSALTVASRSDTSMARSVCATVPEIQRRFGSIVRILSSFTESQIGELCVDA